MSSCALLATHGDSLTYTIAKALSFNGHNVVVYLADQTRLTRGDAVSAITSRLADIPNTSIAAIPSKPVLTHFDRLIVQGHHLLLLDSRLLGHLSDRASSITAITYGDRNRVFHRAIALQWQEYKWYGQWFDKVDRVAYKDGFYWADIHGLLKQRTVIGFDPHSVFLHDPRLYDLLHAQSWSVTARRPYHINFIGSRNPERRQRILDNIERMLAQLDNKTRDQVFWHTYTDDNPAGLDHAAFLRVLERSDFTLAPLGYSLVTHRPIEALLMGSIPVIDERELDLYDIGLKDGVNCIAVSNGDWAGAILRILNMDEERILLMRQNIQGMIDISLRYPVLAGNICRRLGIEQ